MQVGAFSIIGWNSLFRFVWLLFGLVSVYSFKINSCNVQVQVVEVKKNNGDSRRIRTCAGKAQKISNLSP